MPTCDSSGRNTVDQSGRGRHGVDAVIWVHLYPRNAGLRSLSHTSAYVSYTDASDESESFFNRGSLSPLHREPARQVEVLGVAQAQGERGRRLQAGTAARPLARTDRRQAQPLRFPVLPTTFLPARSEPVRVSERSAGHRHHDDDLLSPPFGGSA